MPAAPALLGGTARACGTWCGSHGAPSSVLTAQCGTKSWGLTQEKASGPEPRSGTCGELLVASVPAARSGEGCSWEHQGLLRAWQSSALLQGLCVPHLPPRCEGSSPSYTSKFLRANTRDIIVMESIEVHRPC